MKTDSIGLGSLLNNHIPMPNAARNVFVMITGLRKQKLFMLALPLFLILIAGGILWLITRISMNQVLRGLPDV
jgi:hypothetical protein